jgi:hypothetical protein
MRKKSKECAGLESLAIDISIFFVAIAVAQVIS